MENWDRYLKKALALIDDDVFWFDILSNALADASPLGIHLAIFNEPYLEYLLVGRKTVESRFGVHRCAPYGKVAPHDLIFLKRSSGPIVGVCTITDVWFYSLNPKSWQRIRTEFTDALCAQDPEFWLHRKSASFATLMQIGKVKRLAPIEFPKKDRRGWVVLRSTLNSQGGVFL